MTTERILQAEKVEGEISLVIDYVPGESVAVDVLRGAMQLIEALDQLDRVLLSSVDSSLEPVSILNDVRHSSLKMMLARALRKVPDNHLGALEWKKWVGEILVKGKYLLLDKLDADTPQIATVLHELEEDYRRAPIGLIGYTPPAVSDVRAALDGVAEARAALPGQAVTVQTELGDVRLPETMSAATNEGLGPPETAVTNKGVEFFRVKAPDLLSNAQWTVLRNNRQVRVDMLHQGWLERYHRREVDLRPGDSIECRYEETVRYDAAQNEVERRLAVVEVLRVITPGIQQPLPGTTAS